MSNKTTIIKIPEIQAKSNKKLGFSNFISFSLLIIKLTYFKFLTITILMKLPIIVDKKMIAKIKYTKIQVDSKNKSKSLEFILFLLLISNFSYFK